MLIPPQLNNKIISEQILFAEQMLRVARDELENERAYMAGAQACEQRAKAFMEFLKRSEERRSALHPFLSASDTYLSVGFGGVRAEALEAHMDYLNQIISYARRKEGEVNRLEELVAMLEKDISQLRAVEGYKFGDIQHLFAVKSMGWVRIPQPSGHLFHEHPATDSTMIRPPIPRSSGHP